MGHRKQSAFKSTPPLPGGEQLEDLLSCMFSRSRQLERKDLCWFLLLNYYYFNLNWKCCKVFFFFFSSLKKCPLYHHSQSVANVLLLRGKLFQSVSAGSLGCCCCFSEVMGLEENLHLRGTDTQTLFYCMGTKTVRVEGGLLLLSHFCSILGLAGSSGCLCGFHGSSISVPENIQIFFF